MCMFGFSLGDCKNMFKPKVTIEFLLTKRIFRPKHTFATKNQICPSVFFMSFLPFGIKKFLPCLGRKIVS